MGENIDRRQALLGALAGATLLALRPRSAEAQAEGPTFFASSFQQEQLERQKVTAVDELINGFWNQPRVREHITKAFFDGTQDPSEIRRFLLQESRMYLPTVDKSAEVLRKYSEKLTELSRQIPEQRYGLFLDGDEQALYVLQNAGQNRIQFIKAYPTSTSREAWSNNPNSAGTPLGLHYIAEGRKGMLGEVVAPALRNSRYEVKIPFSEKGKTIRKTFVTDLFGRRVQIPTIITSAFLLVGPTTPPTRAILMHGTNKVHMLGKPDSGGCIRLSNVDSYDLANYVDIKMGKLLEYGKKMPDVRSGTPVMIAATKARPGMAPIPEATSVNPPVRRDTSDTYRPRPRRWNE